jgi:predicted RNase H-like HicB family nuclease
MTYGVLFEDADDGGVGAYLPDVPGLGVVGRDRNEARTLINEGLQFHVEGMIEGGEPLPQPSDLGAFTDTVELDPALVRLAKAAGRLPQTPPQEA